MNVRPLLSQVLFLISAANCFAQPDSYPNDTFPNLSKNNIIRSLQLRVSDLPECVQFKQQLQVAGQAADTGNNTQFTRDIRTIVSNIKSSGCIAQPESVAGK